MTNVDQIWDLEQETYIESTCKGWASEKKIETPYCMYLYSVQLHIVRTCILISYNSLNDTYIYENIIFLKTFAFRVTHPVGTVY